MTRYEIERALDKFAKKQGFRPADAYYIVGEFNLREPNGESVYSDEAHLWCEECADKMLARAHALMDEESREDHFVCAVNATGEDSPARCSSCGAVLDHTLSSYGVASELDHYRANPIKSPISGGEAWEIARIIEAAPDDEEALALGRAALKSLWIEREEVTP